MQRCVSVILFIAMAVGCQHARHRAHAVPTSQAVRDAEASGLTPPVNDPALAAVVVPPVGWKAEPLKETDKHKHQIWLSPTGNTAYGIIFFTMPWPVGQDLALWGFLQQMKRTEGEATLISKKEDDDLPGVRFIAQGGLYLVRTNLIIDGYYGWAIYAGTVRGKPVDESELQTAEQAREQTRVITP